MTCQDSLIIDVLLPLKLSTAFSYSSTAQNSIVKGQLLQVPFRNKQLTGIALNTNSTFQKIAKSITAIHQLHFKTEFLSFLQAASDYNLIPLGQLFKMSISAFSTDSISSNTLTITYADLASQLSAEQSITFASLMTHCDNNQVTLLEGVTGSGKTLVYLSAVEKLININGQALILLPEIALTTQIMERVQKFLPTYNIVQWHSALTPKKRRAIWQSAIKGDPIIVIGARSALFLPFANLKAIVVDEEHDTSFKQDEVAIYNARDMAVLRAKAESCSVILSSATPSIETIQNTKDSKYQHVTLSSRFYGVMMPQIKIVDMTKENLPTNRFISSMLLDSMQKNLSNQKQTLLFLNRKGYAPITLCSKCGTKTKCPNCSSWLVYYKRKSSLQCHYCEYTCKPETTCSNCNSNNMIYYGPGVEKIAEEVSNILPEARIAIATSETVSNHKSASHLLSQITNHEVDVIIGTQVLAKGLDFKLLQLVGVIDADCNYTSGDIRAHERMYQLLHQVSGRAGRQDEQGLVLMQTYEPEHHILQSLATSNTQSFIDAEIADRAASNMPPFSRLFIINLDSKNEHQLLAFAHTLADHAPEIDSLYIMGPSPSPLSLLSGRYRYRFIIKADKKIRAQKIISQWLASVVTPSTINVKVDVDPYNFG